MAAMLRLSTFGGLALGSDDGSPPPRVRPQRLAILAVLAAAPRGFSRQALFGIFWPDADEERARHSLRQALYALRQELGADVVLSDPTLSLDRRTIGSDIADFRSALAGGDRALAASLATGPFLDGFYLPGAAGFERWVEEERASLTAEAVRVLLALAKDAESKHESEAAVDWWRRLTLLDPLSGRFALGYLRALAAHGDRAGALAFARVHEQVVRHELEADPNPEIRRLEAELRAMPSPSPGRGAPARTAFPDHVAPVPARTVERPIVGMLAALGALALVGALTADRWAPAFGARSTKAPTFAVGMIRDEGLPDTLRIGGVLTDMLATNLARVASLSVVANARLFELMGPGQDTISAGYLEAARRAGANEVLQGRLLAGPQWTIAMEMQRVDVKSGLVRSAYRVAASNRYALIDSMTAAIAHDLQLRSPAGSIAAATTESPIAYRLYEEGLRAYYQHDEPGARRLMQAALREDSTFAMAAYYDARMSREGDGDETARRARALRLAARAPERERLMITAHVLQLNVEPEALAVAESLVTKFPGDPRAFALHSNALSSRGDWDGAARTMERAIAIDSASDPVDRQDCRICIDLAQLSDIYLWWDSLPAAERAAQRFLRVRPKDSYPWHILVSAAAARGDTTAADTLLRRYQRAFAGPVSTEYVVRRLILMERYDEAARRVQPLLDSPNVAVYGPGRWMKVITLRNQGRLREALQIVRRGTPHPQAHGLVTLESGDAQGAVSILAPLARSDQSPFSPGIRARHTTWFKTLYGRALAAAGDTLRLRALADTVELWGQRSNYGRDRRAHHYLRGVLLIARGRDAEAAVELREAIHSSSHGFTRVNYELGKTLLRLDRPADAVPVVRAALHGDIDGSNLYMTRTELHELLAQAFDRLGARDSAAVHYRAVAKAWERADPMFHTRRDRARAWLSARGNPR
jgi:DNA-binding SARP family transcriptional activator/tetratricopeptide (TPR) repeat protein